MNEQLNEPLIKILNKATEWEYVSLKSDEAHEYCQKYLMPEAWGKNIWHAILEDAIKLRKEFNRL